MRNIDAIVDDLLANIALRPMPLLVYQFQLKHKNLTHAAELIKQLEQALSDENTVLDASIQDDKSTITELCELANSQLDLCRVWLSYSGSCDTIQLTEVTPGKAPSSHKLALFFNQLIAAIYNLHGILACETKVQIDNFPNLFVYAAHAFNKAYDFAPKDSFEEKVVSANMLLLLGRNLEAADISAITQELIGFARNYISPNLNPERRIILTTLPTQQKTILACIYDSIATRSDITSIKFEQNYTLRQQAFMLWNQCPIIGANLANLLYSRPDSTMDEVYFALKIYRQLLSLHNSFDLLIHNMLAQEKLVRMQLPLLEDLQTQQLELQRHAQETQNMLFDLSRAKENVKAAIQKSHLTITTNKLAKFNAAIQNVEAFINQTKGPLEVAATAGQHAEQPVGLMPNFTNYVQKHKYAFASAVSVLCGLAAYGYGQVLEQQTKKMSFGA